jgi:signal transduction histidine kinase
MFIGFILFVFLSNLIVSRYFAQTEIQSQFATKLMQEHLRWQATPDANQNPQQLKARLMHAIRTTNADEVLIFSPGLRNAAFPDAYLDAEIIERLPANSSEQKLEQAIVKFKGKLWTLTQLDMPATQIVTATSHAVVDQQLHEISLLRVETLKRTFPVILAIVILGALFLTRKMLEPIFKIQTSLQKLNSRDLSVRIPTTNEDKEFVEFINVFNAMLERLEKNFMQASRFSSDAAHELRTPLTIIQGQVERAINEALPESKSQIQLTLIADEIQRLNTITQKLLLLSQADAGRLYLELESINISDMLDELVSDASMFGQQLKIKSRIQKKIKFKTDLNLFQPLLNNLLTNALKYNIVDGWIEVIAFTQDGQLHLSFANPSAGIVAQSSAQLFERFYRDDSAHNRKIDGTGLGLSICREIAHANNGTLTFDIDAKNIVKVTLIAPLS